MIKCKIWILDPPIKQTEGAKHKINDFCFFKFFISMKKNPPMAKNARNSSRISPLPEDKLSCRFLFYQGRWQHMGQSNHHVRYWRMCCQYREDHVPRSRGFSKSRVKNLFPLHIEACLMFDLSGEIVLCCNVQKVL